MTDCLYKQCGFLCGKTCGNENESCPRMNNLRLAMDVADLSDIPQKKLMQTRNLKFAKVDEAAAKAVYEIFDTLPVFVHEGNSLLLVSKNCGNGKTSWSIKMLLNYLMVSVNKTSLEFGAVYGIFVRPHALMNRIKASFSNPDPELNDYLNNLKLADLVVWDDLGCAKVSPYDQNILIDIIGFRELYGRANIYTSNLNSFEKLADSVGERLASRIWNGSTVIELRGADRRGKKC